MQLILNDLYCIVNKKDWDSSGCTYEFPRYVYTSITEAMRSCFEDEIVIKFDALFERISNNIYHY